MANRTDTAALQVHGTDPKNLIDSQLRESIYNSSYWIEECFGLDALTIIDKASNLTFVGIQLGSLRKPTSFVCLLLKLLQIQPSMKIIVEYLKQEQNKYLRVLAAFYIRLVAKPYEVFRFLEPLYADFRKIRTIDSMNDGIILSHIDEIITQLLTTNYVFSLQFPALPPRGQLEFEGLLKPRQSWLSIHGQFVFVDNTLPDVDMSSIDITNPFYLERQEKLAQQAIIDEAIANGGRLLPDGTIVYHDIDDADIKKYHTIHEQKRKNNRQIPNLTFEQRQNLTPEEQQYRRKHFIKNVSNTRIVTNRTTIINEKFSDQQYIDESLENRVILEKKQTTQQPPQHNQKQYQQLLQQKAQQQSQQQTPRDKNEWVEVQSELLSNPPPIVPLEISLPQQQLQQQIQQQQQDQAFEIESTPQPQQEQQQPQQTAHAVTTTTTMDLGLDDYSDSD